MPGPLRLANRVFASTGTLLILVQMVVICSDIAGRGLFNHPIPGVFEIVELTIVAIVFLQIPNAIGTDGFIRSDALFLNLASRHPRVGQMLEATFCLIGALVMCAIAYGVWFKFQDAWELDLFTGNPGIFTAPIWPMLLCVVAGSVLGALNYVARGIGVVMDRKFLTEGASHDGN